MKKRTSKVWRINKQELEKLVKESNSLGKVLSFFGLKNKGGNPKTLKQRLKEENISFSHMRMGISSNTGRKFNNQLLAEQEALDKYFRSDSDTDRKVIKRYVKTYSLIKYNCECGNDGFWCGKKLSLQLDHINGVSNDNRLENLRWLCPNCHSQTKTFAGKKRKIEV